MKTTPNQSTERLVLSDADCFKLSPEDRLIDLTSPDSQIYSATKSINNAILDHRQSKANEDDAVFGLVSRSEQELVIMGGDYYGWYRGELQDFFTDTVSTIARNKNKDVQAKLESAARGIGALVSGLQSLPDGNKATSRVLAGGIVGGYDFLGTAYKSHFSFMADQETEQKIQNNVVSQLRLEYDARQVGCWSENGFNVRLGHASDALEKIKKADNRFPLSILGKYMAVHRLIGSRYRFSEHDKLIDRATLALMQRDYGASILAATDGVDELGPLEPSQLVEINETAKKAAFSRLKSLVRLAVGVEVDNGCWRPVPDFSTAFASVQG